MNIPWRTIIWQQFGAAIDISTMPCAPAPTNCGVTVCGMILRRRSFTCRSYWYIVYHALFWLDLYLTGAEEGFVPPAPFLLIEQDETVRCPKGPIPKRNSKPISSSAARSARRPLRR